MDFLAAFKDHGDYAINILPAFGGGELLIRACHFLYFENITTIFLKTLFKRTEKGAFYTPKCCALFGKEKIFIFEAKQ